LSPFGNIFSERTKNEFGVKGELHRLKKKKKKKKATVTTLMVEMFFIAGSLVRVDAVVSTTRNTTRATCVIADCSD